MTHWSNALPNFLTYWGWVTHICISKWTIIGSDNGLLLGWHQAIIWTNAGILLIGLLGTNFSEILIEIHTFSFKKMHLNVSSAKWRPFCLGLNVLKYCGQCPFLLKNMGLSAGLEGAITQYCNKTLQWSHNGHDSVSNHQPYACLLNRLFRRRSKKTSKLPITGLCAGNSPGTGEFPAQIASYAENVSIWWRHHDITDNATEACSTLAAMCALEDALTHLPLVLHICFSELGQHWFRYGLSPILRQTTTRTNAGLLSFGDLGIMKF